MDNTNQRKALIKGDIAIFLRGLIIGKVLTLMVIGGLLWWLLKPEVLSRNNTVSSGTTNFNSTSSTQSTFKSLTDVPIGSFNYGGSTAWAPIRQVVDRMLLDGKLDFAQSSRPLTEQEQAIAKEKGFTLEQSQVGIDGIAVVVNPSLKVPGLTVDQLQQIYSGQITNWNQVGGPNLPITPFSQKPENADTTIFSIGSNVKYVYSTTDAVRQLSNTPGGIYYASARAVVPQCSVKPLPLGRTSADLVSPYREPLVSPEQCPRQRNQVNTEAIKNGNYPITSNLYVILKQNNGPEQKAGEAYAKLLLTEQGQKAIEQAGFVGVR